MDVLIVTSMADLGALWGRHLERSGAVVRHAASQEQAVAALDAAPADIVVLNMELVEGSAIAVADYAGYRCPDAKIISVTGDSFFSDGSIFALLPNVCAQVSATADPGDLVAMVDHYGSDTQS